MTACTRYHSKILTALVVVLLTGCQFASHQKTGGLAEPAAPGQITVTVNHNGGDTASPGFKFQNIPSPSKTDSATTAQFTIVDGEVDPHSGGLSMLHDGRLPTEADQPSANFFFNTVTDGGRLLIDLGKVIEIKEVITYSWHPRTRGPQVYELYASNGRANEFNFRPKRGTNPDSCGWQLVANVDTRLKYDGSGGCQKVWCSFVAGVVHASESDAVCSGSANGAGPGGGLAPGRLHRHRWALS